MGKCEASSNIFLGPNCSESYSPLLPEHPKPKKYLVGATISDASIRDPDGFDNNFASFWELSNVLKISDDDSASPFHSGSKECITNCKNFKDTPRIQKRRFSQHNQQELGAKRQKNGVVTREIQANTLPLHNDTELQRCFDWTGNENEGNDIPSSSSSKKTSWLSRSHPLLRSLRLTEGNGVTLLESIMSRPLLESIMSRVSQPKGKRNSYVEKRLKPSLLPIQMILDA